MSNLNASCSELSWVELSWVTVGVWQFPIVRNLHTTWEDPRIIWQMCPTYHGVVKRWSVLVHHSRICPSCWGCGLDYPPLSPAQQMLQNRKLSLLGIVICYNFKHTSTILKKKNVYLCLCLCIWLWIIFIESYIAKEIDFFLSWTQLQENRWKKIYLSAYKSKF